MLQYLKLGDKLVEVVPKLRPAYEELLVEWGNQRPGQHVVFGDLLLPHIEVLLESAEDAGALRRVFDFLEDLANEDDKRIQEVVAFSIVEPLVDDVNLLTEVWPFMGQTTRRFAREVSKYWGTSQSFPFSSD